MKQAIVLAISAIVVGAASPGAGARPAREPAHIVPLPPIRISRHGGWPSGQVDRGRARTPAMSTTIVPAGVDRGAERTRQPLVLAHPWQRRIEPQRNQVLALRKQVEKRYKGRGVGAHLGWEIP